MSERFWLVYPTLVILLGLCLHRNFAFLLMLSSISLVLNLWLTLHLIMCHFDSILFRVYEGVCIYIVKSLILKFFRLYVSEQVLCLFFSFPNHCNMCLACFSVWWRPLGLVCCLFFILLLFRLIISTWVLSHALISFSPWLSLMLLSTSSKLNTITAF